MDTVRAVVSRRSVRAFRSKPVPMSLLADILRTATRAPSANNTQPWRISIVSGSPLCEIKRCNIEMLESGTVPNPELKSPRFEGEYRERQRDLAAAIFQLMHIGKEDAEAVHQWMLEGYRFFDAPVGIIISKDKSLDGYPHSLLDIGALIQSICLLCESYGLGTCIVAQAVAFPDVIRQYTRIPLSQRILIAVAVGYPDEDSPVNRLSSDREPIGKTVAWYGLGEEQSG